MMALNSDLQHGIVDKVTRPSFTDPVLPGVLRQVLALILAAWILTIFTGPPAAADTARQAVVMVDRLNVRPSPGLESPPIETFDRGTVVRVIGETAQWWKVLVGDRIGYIQHQEKFLSFAPPSAESDDNGADDEKRRAAEDLQRRIARKRQAVADKNREEARVLDRLDRAARTLADTQTRLTRLRAEIDALEESMADARRTSQTLREKIGRDAVYVKQRLVSLYKLGRLGNLQLLASAQSMSDLQRRRKALSSILDYDRRKLADYHRQVVMLDELTVDLSRSHEQRQALEREAEAAWRAAAHEKEAKSRLLEEIRSQKSLALEALEDLRRSARELEQTVAAVQSPTSAPVDKAPTGQATFSDSKGLLKLPVRGKIVSFYGSHRHPIYNVTNFNNGIDIRASQGDPVKAVWRGVVVFSNWFRGYGNLIIVNHGDSYHTLYAHLAERFKQKGDPVEKGEVIGTAGDTGPVKEPGVHFQVRYHGKAVDPLEWIQRG